MPKKSLKHLIWKADDQYVALCLNIGISSFGATRQKAIANLNKELELYFDENPISSISKVNNPQIATQDMFYE